MTTANSVQKLSQGIPDEVQVDYALPSEEVSSYPTSNFQSIKNAVTQLNAENTETCLSVCPPIQPDKSSVNLGPCSARTLPYLFAEIKFTEEAEEIKREDPEFAEKAYQYLQQLLCPSVLKYSGEKYQAYWFLEEPWIFSDEKDQEVAKTYIERFQSAITKCFEFAFVDNVFISIPTTILRIPRNANCQNQPFPYSVDTKYPYADDPEASIIPHFSRKTITAYINYLLDDQTKRCSTPTFECDMAKFILKGNDRLTFYQAALKFPAVLPYGCLINDKHEIVFQKVKKKIIGTVKIPMIGISHQFCNPYGKLLDAVTFLTTDGHLKSVLCNPSTLATTAGITTLANYGLLINKEIIPDIVEFLICFKEANSGIMPVIKTTSKMGWQSDHSFFPGNSNLMFIEEGSNYETTDQLSPQGDLATWVAIMKKAKENTGVRLAMAASFGSPLLHLFRIRTHFIHLYGPSTGGKSAAQYAGSSIWMSPQKAVKTFNVTGNSLDFYLDKMNHLPIFLGEMQIVKGNQKFIDQLIYKTCESQGKLRGTSNGGLQNKTSWNSITITSGEHPLTSTLTNQGVFTRVMEFYLSPVVSDKNLAQKLYRFTNEHHGLAGQRFIHMIKSMDTEMLQYCFSTFQRHISSMIPSESRIIPAYRDYLTILAVADYYSSQEIFGEHEQSAFPSALQFIHSLIKLLVSAEPEDELHRAKAFIEDWLLQQHSHFGVSGKNIPHTPPNGKCYGYKFPSHRTAVITTVLQKALCAAGLNWDSLKHGFAENGWVYVGKDRGSKVYTKKYSNIPELGNVRFTELIGFGSNASDLQVAPAVNLPPHIKLDKPANGDTFEVLKIGRTG